MANTAAVGTHPTGMLYCCSCLVTRWWLLLVNVGCSLTLLPPANEVWGKLIFLHQFVILFTGGHAWLLPGGAWLFGGHAWFYSGGVCVVLFRGHAWFFRGGMHGFIQGVCVVLFGGHAWFYLGGHVWFYLGGMRGFSGGEGSMRGFFSFFGYNEIRSILLECILVIVAVVIGQRG